MKAIVIYESLTGNTRKAAELIARDLELEGISTGVSSVTEINMQALSEADLVIIGSWVDGLFFFGQKPGRSGRIASMPNLSGKKVVVYCTYAVKAGKTLEKLETAATKLGGDVLGGYTIKRQDLEGGAKELVDRLTSALASDS